MKVTETRLPFQTYESNCISETRADHRTKQEFLMNTITLKNPRTLSLGKPMLLSSFSLVMAIYKEWFKA